MISKETKRKIHYLRIRTKKTLMGSLIGENNTVFKGTGVEFDQIREYEEGDDVRFIHWVSSAKKTKLLVKQYFEERNRNMIIAMDISASSNFSSSSLKKYDLMVQVATVLDLAAQYSKDNVGLLLFSDKIHDFVAPNQGFFHHQNILKKICEQKINNNSKTNINVAFEFLIKNVKKDTIVFFISDFIDENNFESSLNIIQKKMYFVPIRCLDKNENELPKAGIINVVDFETSQEMILNLNDNYIKILNDQISNILNHQSKLFLKYKIKLLNIKSEKDLFHDLINYFKYLML